MEQLLCASDKITMMMTDYGTDTEGKVREWILKIKQSQQELRVSILLF